jgi:probable rRNA maturation factor
MLPGLSLHNRQRTHAFDMRYLLAIGIEAMPVVLSRSRAGSPLRELALVEACVIGDRTMARLHASHMQDPSPTDVLTFHHGEILLGAGVITRQAPDFGHSPTEEAALCLVHGLLHLAGWDDRTPAAARRMASLQAGIFSACRG